MPRVTLVRLVFVYVLVVGCLSAQIAKANLCDAAAYLAAQETRVPVDVLLAITRVETGRSNHGNEPWPWTVNNAGNGTWFDNEDAARRFVYSRVKSGASNLDIGCFQINYRWHAKGFRDLDAMFDPDLNALYAAQFLESLYQEFGDWTAAAGAFHSRTPEFADRYKAKFEDFRTHLASFVGVKSPRARKQGLGLGNDTKPTPGSLFFADAANVTPLIDLRRAD